MRSWFGRLSVSSATVPLILVLWCGAMVGGAWWAGPWALRWAIDQRGWQPPNPPAPEPVERTTSKPGVWMVPLSEDVEVWDRWEKTLQNRLEHLEPEQLSEELQPLLPWLEEHAGELSPLARARLARMLDRAYQLLVRRGGPARWPVLAQLHQVRQGLQSPIRSEQMGSLLKAPASDATRASSAQPAHSSQPKSSPVNNSPHLASSTETNGLQAQEQAPRETSLAGAAVATANQAQRLPLGVPVGRAQGHRPPGPQPASASPTQRQLRPSTAPVPGDSLWELWRAWAQSSSPIHREQLWKRLSQKVQEPKLLHALAQLVQASPLERLGALETLAQQLGSGAEPWLWWATEDQDARVRLEALSILAASNDPQLLRRVYRRALQDESPQVRQLAQRIQKALR